MKGLFGLAGLSLPSLAKAVPVGASKYFNTGKLHPLDENSRDLYNQFYGDRAVLGQYYNEHRLGLYEAISQHVCRSGIVLDDTDMIDVGCGSGHLLAELQKWSNPRSLTGCDFAEMAIAFSRETFPAFRFFCHDIYDPLPGSYDVISCTEVLEHLERPFIAIQNLVKAARPSGILVLTVPNGRLDQLNEHINFWSPESWKIFVERECPGCRSICSTLLNGQFNIAIIRCPAA